MVSPTFFYPLTLCSQFNYVKIINKIKVREKRINTSFLKKVEKQKSTNKTNPLTGNTESGKHLGFPGYLGDPVPFPMAMVWVATKNTVG